MQPKRTSSPRALEPSPMADISLSLRTAFMDNAHYRRESDSLSTSALSSASGSPTSSPGSSWPFRKHRFSGSNYTGSNSRDRSRSPFANVIPFSFRRSSPFFLRRRPSAVDLALSEERSRCDEDVIERLGLNMMEPRPVDPIPIAMDLNAHVVSDIASQRSSCAPSSQSSARSSMVQPRYVMGGIVEVMEGRA